ncbi:hypothetical protein [Eubacterium sp. 1001713B170207_170306_E7]|nr:hypothetical protein [Eubacterium sp. 1001713B170207_170306_E7]
MTELFGGTPQMCLSAARAAGDSPWRDGRNANRLRAVCTDL